MNVVSASIGVLVFGVAGYMLEPYLRQRTVVVNVESSAHSTHAETSAEDAPLDLSLYRDDQLPAKVQVKRDVEVRSADSDVPMIVPAGARVTLLRREQDRLIISSAPGLEGSVAASDTDLFRQLRTQPAPAPAAVIPAPTPAVEPMPEPVVTVTPEPANPPSTPTPTEEPAPAEPSPAVAVSLDAAQIVNAMEASVKAEQIKKFSYAAVTSWKAGDNEMIDGQDYQTGLITYKDQTIFGVKNIQAKALILNGKVQRWIWPTSGLEIP